MPTQPTDGKTYRIRPAADPTLALGIPGASQADGATVSTLAASDTDTTTCWKIERLQWYPLWQAQCVGTGKWMDDRSHFGVTDFRVACQWGKHNVQSGSDWQAWSIGGESTSVLWEPNSFTSIPGVLIEVGSAVPMWGLDAFGDSPSVRNAPAMGDLTNDLTEANIGQLWFMTPCDVYDPSIRGVEQFDVIVNEGIYLPSGHRFEAPLERLSLSMSSSRLFDCIYLPDAPGCRARARVRFIDPRTGERTDWLKTFGDSTPTSPALADPDWGAAWYWRAADQQVGYLAGAGRLSSPVTWSDAPSDAFTICELEVSCRRCGAAAGVVGPITTQTYRIARRPALTLGDNCAMVSGEGIRLSAATSLWQPGCFLRASVRYDDEEIVDGWVTPVPDPLETHTTTDPVTFDIDWEACRDVPVDLFNSLSLPATLRVAMELVTPYGIVSAARQLSTIAIGTTTPSSFVSPSPSIIADDGVALRAATGGANYGFIVLPDGHGSTRVVRMWSEGIVPGNGPAVLSTADDLADVTARARRLVALAIDYQNDILTSVDPWYIMASGAAEIRAAQSMPLASLSWGSGAWHVLPLEGDISVSHSISVPIVSAQRPGADVYVASALAGQTPTMKLSGRLYADELARLADEVDIVEIERGWRGLRETLSGRRVLVRLPYGDALWAVVASVDIPRSTGRCVDITLELIEVA